MTMNNSEQSTPIPAPSTNSSASAPSGLFFEWVLLCNNEKINTSTKAANVPGGVLFRDAGYKERTLEHPGGGTVEIAVAYAEALAFVPGIRITFINNLPVLEAIPETASRQFPLPLATIGKMVDARTFKIGELVRENEKLTRELGEARTTLEALSNHITAKEKEYAHCGPGAMISVGIKELKQILEASK
jgi:hypothetical protein